MTLDQIRYFVRAAELLHLGHAALELRISPSAISHAISSLESEIGRKLFLREKKRLKLTEQGYLFLINSKEILGKLENLKESVTSDSNEYSGTIKIASVSAIISTILVPAWGKVAKVFPNAKIEFIETRSPIAIDLCLDGSVDLAICFSKFHADHLDSQDILAGDVYKCVNRNHPILKVERELLKRSLAKFPFISPRKNERTERVFDCDLLSIVTEQENVTSYSFESYEVAHSLLQNTLAWGALPDWVIQHYKSDLVAIDKASPIAPYKVTAYFRKKRFLHKPLLDLLGEINRQSKSVL